MIEYKLNLKSPQAHIFEVELKIDKPDRNGQVVFLPAWIRGSYLIRDYARHIITIQAFCKDRQIGLQKLNKHSWIVEPVASSITIRYLVYAWELTVRSSHFDLNHAYFNGPALFLGVKGQEMSKCCLEIVAPDDQQIADWKVAIPMHPVKTDEKGFGRYIADTYEDFIDCPAEIGRYSESEFSVASCNHRLIVSGSNRFDHESICSCLERICSEQVELFGELPIQEYTFFLQLVDDGYGGLEHKNSTSLIFSRDELPSKNDTKISPGYRRLLALCSHEYFHLWNVKRITPQPFLEQNTSQEVYTKQLWVFEGITSYYDELMLVRSGVIEAEGYFEMLAETVTRVMRGSGRKKQTLEESSFDVWTKFYKQDENAPNAIVSYYAKGALFALVLDLTIRIQSEGLFSLDHIMRAMWQKYGKNSEGVPEGGFEEVAAEVTSLNLKSLFELGLRSTEELPLAECLEAFGVEMKLLPAKSQDDKGGVITKSENEQNSYSVIGAKWIDKNGTVYIQQVFDGGAAQEAGVSAGDEIIAVDGQRKNTNQFDRYIADTDPGETVQVHLFRRGTLMNISLKPRKAPSDTCYFYLTEQKNPEISKRYTEWLMGNG
jgi:predicted metalloprotease with PDZ domain